ncbi:MAG TPA: hydroxymethylpyrimidine/phosphomethylpyrimidine kinase, partial [Burkholderiaceae bacterium]|nr:hydroxymethylpyrimidine/phosphomethylpyrimidine kinase [Burkholderiaceae bacterium]
MNTHLLPPEDPPEADDVNGAPDDDPAAGIEDDGRPPCVLVFNASDPSGAGGLGADALAISSVGAHMLGVVTGAYARDTAEVFDH